MHNTSVKWGKKSFFFARRLKLKKEKAVLFMGITSHLPFALAQH